MRLLFVADGRSPTTLSWLRYWCERGDEVHLISTFPCPPPPGLVSFRLVPVAFSRLAKEKREESSTAHTGSGRMGRLRPWLLLARYWLGPLSLLRHWRPFRAHLLAIQPDLVHALRIPFEGMLSAATPRRFPLIVSTWGNDFTLHARGSPLMSLLTRRTLQRTDGLMTDTRRDVRLAREWGYPIEKPTLTLPGAGGIRLEAIAAAKGWELPEELPDSPIIVNPRGQRPGSLRQDIFFQAIPLVLEKIPQAVFVCPSLQGEADAEEWVTRLDIRSQTRLWPLLADQRQLWALFHRAQVYVSPSIHDGTPNSLLEAMACSCFPVVGNVESLREWVQDGVNGILVDANSPTALAEAIVRVLQNPYLREEAKKENARIIAEHADYRRCMAMAEAFYQRLLSGE